MAIFLHFFVFLVSKSLLAHFAAGYTILSEESLQPLLLRTLTTKLAGSLSPGKTTGQTARSPPSHNIERSTLHYEQSKRPADEASRLFYRR